ncbi:hypothetical protein LWM68_01390 [Niabella sp. W65]|nr:hypothetical protein [Niabella sp. W65]MCH7361556.1 hypothetical protein [Niabella sp. W65]ULT45350.1 hypothetical protein KRR40_19955 [Niabella sp. I65]
MNHRVTGSQELIYTNNSPDNLKFLWLQLDQNIYRKDSRGSATTTASGADGLIQALLKDRLLNR